MNQLPPDDPRLSAFLRQYRPAPPSSQGDIEDYLFARIEQDVQTESKNIFWILSSAVVAGVIIGWGAYKFNAPPQIAASSPELEYFVLESWDRGTREEVAYFNHTPSLTNDWLLVTNPIQGQMVEHK